MSLWETFTLAVKNISGSKMRTFLTMLGIIIGVCAVIVIVGMGNGMQSVVMYRLLTADISFSRITRSFVFAPTMASAVIPCSCSHFNCG